ncbi:Plasmid pRiA4b ORF-3-like protein [Salinisphaera sp. PC39]|uniref:plasmid pRiA4b ORF-3 family protein n=1 Tax=Salinisphaera sp. PC39 TaxID=1304156 RepID=UPI003341A66A
MVYRFKITLLEIKPEIWRLIEVPGTYSFWDLHVAIQDAMGWLDYHLHEFQAATRDADTPVSIGIPEDESDDRIQAGWKVPIGEHFQKPGDSALYEYDFGDGWAHKIMLESIEPASPGTEYPRCVDGDRACPPEDCGGEPGYNRLLDILANPEDPEYEDMVDWLKNHAKNYHPYQPEVFDPQSVEFWDPEIRFQMMMDG